jgi:hypothetical protein
MTGSIVDGGWEDYRMADEYIYIYMHHKFFLKNFIFEISGCWMINSRCLDARYLEV